MLVDFIYKVRSAFQLETKIVVNITDIDDKIFDWFAEKPILDITDRKTYQEKTALVLKNFYQCLENLKTSYKKWKFVRVSEELSSLKETVSSLEPLLKLKEGLKVEQNSFFIWKGGHLISSEETKTFPFQGHPSWHLECSHIIKKELGQYEQILHLGGADLKILHHPNEVYLLKKFKDHKIKRINFFYSGLYFIEGEKMSKSRGNQTYFTSNYREEIINFYLSDFNRPLTETKKRNEEIQSLSLKIKNLTTLPCYTISEIKEILKNSPSSTYRLNKLNFIKLLSFLKYL